MRRFFHAVFALSIAIAVPVSPVDAADDSHRSHRAVGGEAPATDSSLYQIPGSWTDQDGASFDLASLRGSPVLVVLFYGTCESVCPTVVRDVKKLEALLPTADRARTRVLLVSFDPSVDTPPRLLEYARKHDLDRARWTLLNGSPEQIRVLANVLGVRYRATGTGHYSHTIRISVLDRDGAVVDHSDGLDRPLEPIAARISSLLEALPEGD